MPFRETAHDTGWGGVGLKRPRPTLAPFSRSVEEKPARQSLCHLQGVRAVIVVGVGEVPHLFDEQPCAWRASLESDDPPGQVRREPPDADQLVQTCKAVSGYPDVGPPEPDRRTAVTETGSFRRQMRRAETSADVPGRFAVAR